MRRAGGVLVATLVVLAVVLVPYGLTALVPQWPLWACAVFGVVTLLAFVVAWSRGPDDSEPPNEA